MTPPLSNGRRDLLLSQYLDGELEPELRAQVEERLKGDPVWRREYELMQNCERQTGDATRRFHANAHFTASVMRRLKKASTRSKSALPPARRRLWRRANVRRSGWWMPAAALVALGFSAWFAYRQWLSPPANIATGPATPTREAATGPEIQCVKWPDGSLIWLRRGSRLESLGRRSAKLAGEALFRVAPDKAAPFVVVGPHGREAQALGTCFEVKTAEDEGLRVRVAEGHVRVKTGPQSGAAALDVFGGTELLPNLSLRGFDPRELGASWQAANIIVPQPVAPWSQTGGQARHTGITPLPGPARLVAAPEKYIALPEGQMAVAGAVLGANERAYLVSMPAGERETKLLELNLATGGWKECATLPGQASQPAVLTPEGLAVFAANSGALAAYDPVSKRVKWRLSEPGVTGLCVLPDGVLLISSTSGLVAVKSATGEPCWRCAQAANLSAPATLLPDGSVCATARGGRVYLVSSAGQVQRLLASDDEIAGCAVTPVPNSKTSDDWVWLLSTRGQLSRLYLTGAPPHGASWRESAPAATCAPLASGLYGAGNTLVRSGNIVAARPPSGDAFIALVQDGQGQVFAAYRNAVVRLQGADDNGKLKEAEYCAIRPGNILPDGLALAFRKLVVTTAHGVQVFE